MKTVTFYSYKGGVGRSLALSNIAIRLSELKKKVCVLDFDLEAPGLQFKFNSYTKSKPIEKGLVDYIDEFSSKGNVPKAIAEYCIDLLSPSNIFEKIQLIPAGNIDDSVYWEKLSGIDWAAMFYKEDSKGVQFILDLKYKIETELKPDFLLIDSRTGITDIAGITLKLLADEVVILAANNQENIFGSKKIIKSLSDKENSLLNKAPRITFILTRLPFTDSPKDKSKEFAILQNRTHEFKSELLLSNFEIMVIHSDRRLEESERPLIGDNYEAKTISISNDYLKLFDRLASDVLTTEEMLLFKNRKMAEKEYISAVKSADNAEKLIYLAKAIEFDSNRYEYYFERGYIYQTIKEYDNAEKDYLTSLQLNPESKHVLNQLAILYTLKKQYGLALSYSERAIQKDKNDCDSFYTKAVIINEMGRYEDALKIFNYIIEREYSESGIANVLNGRADTLRSIGKYNDAYSDIFRAIELVPDEPLYFATLAEIYADDSKNNEFYLNLNISLSKGANAEMLSFGKEVYKRFANEQRFLELMAKYSIDINEILEDK